MDLFELELKSYCYDADRLLYASIGKYLFISPIYKIIICDTKDEFINEPDKVPACTGYVDGEYHIYFNKQLINEKFKDYIRLICYHEVAHVYCDDIYKYHNELIDQPKSTHKGHPRLFFQLMNLFKLDEMERQLQHVRHEIPYKYGTSDGFGINYNPLDKLFQTIFKGIVLSSVVNFSERLKSSFSKLGF